MITLERRAEIVQNLQILARAFASTIDRLDRLDDLQLEQLRRLTSRLIAKLPASFMRASRTAPDAAGAVEQPEAP